MFSRMNPQEWLKQLVGSMTSTRCRLAGEEVDLAKGYEALSSIFLDLKASGSTLWWVGNGGSAAVCSHLSQDCLNKLGLRSGHLNDPSLMSCMANDYGYGQVYRRPLMTLAREGDALIAISSSGNSENIVNCVSLAQERGIKIVTLSGFHEDNSLWNGPSDVAFFLPATFDGMVEVGHEALLHAVIECMWHSMSRKEDPCL